MRTPPLLSAGRAAIDQYLPAVGPTAANPLQQQVAAEWHRCKKR